MGVPKCQESIVTKMLVLEIYLESQRDSDRKPNSCFFFPFLELDKVIIKFIWNRGQEQPNQSEDEKGGDATLALQIPDSANRTQSGNVNPALTAFCFHSYGNENSVARCKSRHSD